MFAYIWEYRVRPDMTGQFRCAYGPGGAWVELFSKSAEYLRTELHRAVDDPQRFLTVDYWASKQARDEFIERFAGDYAAIDKACEAFTMEERFVGDFILDSGDSGV